MRIGSEEHKDLFCRDFEESHRRFEPEELPWPALDETGLKRLRSVPFWQEVFQTERRAGAIVEAFSKTVDDPQLKHAIDLQGYEEARHGRLIAHMIERYGLEATEEPYDPLPADIRTGFVDFGYGECLDSFLGFGVFKIARQSGFLPDEMFSVFDVLMYEETRHIVFFVNWMAYDETRRGRGFAPWRALTSAYYYYRAIARLVGTVRRGQQQGDGQNFSATQADVFLEDFSILRLVRACLSENGRRMATFDPRLLRPRFFPALGRIAYGAMSLWPKKAAPARAA